MCDIIFKSVIGVNKALSKFFIKSNQIVDNKIIILGTDVNHIKNVLRLKVDDDIKVCNSDTSKNYICTISQIASDKIECTIFKELSNEVEGNVELDIFQGLPKADKMELIIQKGTELGVNSFIPVSFKRCVVKLSGKDADKKIERWNKISEVAAKQCGRDIIPEVRKIETLKEVCNQIKNYDLFIVAYEGEDKNYIRNELLNIKKLKDSYKIAVVIGPEGGIDIEEINLLKESKAKIVSLGKRILRTETVALQVSSIIMYELENGGDN